MIEDGKSIAGIAWPKQSICALRVKESLRGASFPHCADVTVASRWFFLDSVTNLALRRLWSRISEVPCPPIGLKNQTVGRTSSVRSSEFLSRLDFLKFQTLELSHFHDVWVVHGWSSFLFAQRAAMLSQNTCKSARLQLSQLETRDRA